METNLAARLKELRGARSQADFAKEFGEIQQTYARWENGSREPELEKVKKIARRFGVTTDWLLGADPIDHTKTEKLPGPEPPSIPAITAKDLASLIEQNRELSHAASALGEAHKEIAKTNGQLAAKLMEMCATKADTPAVQGGGGRATKAAG